MAINQYLNRYNAKRDQRLIEDLMIECIKNTGLDVWYMPRKLYSEDKIFLEDNCSVFDKAYPIEVYFKNVTNWDGRNDFLSKFGLQIEEKGKLTISIRRFREIVKAERPYEGDWIYLPLTDCIYHITFVEHETIMHQLGELQVWDLDIDLMNYSHQKIRTGFEFIDRFENERSFAVEFNLLSGTNKFVLNEAVYQGSSLSSATARGICVLYNHIEKKIKLKDVYGKFDSTLPLIGHTSAAVYQINNFDEKTLPNDAIATNLKFEQEDAAKEIIDWSEKNPFGE